MLKWKRHPSMGVAHPDITNERVDENGVVEVLATMEHKSTHSLPQFMVKAISQARVNAERYPGKPAFIGITYHGPGRKVYRLMCREVFLDDELSEDFLESEAA